MTRERCARSPPQRQSSATRTSRCLTTWSALISRSIAVRAAPTTSTPDVSSHEPFVLFGFLAASTSLELVTSILILPQRQTVLVA